MLVFFQGTTGAGSSFEGGRGLRGEFLGLCRNLTIFLCPIERGARRVPRGRLGVMNYLELRRGRGTLLRGGVRGAIRFKAHLPYALQL